MEALDARERSLKEGEKSTERELNSLKDSEKLLHHGQKKMDDRDAEIRKRENEMRKAEHDTNEKHLHAMREIESANGKEAALNAREELLSKRDTDNKQLMGKLHKEAAAELNEARQQQHIYETKLHR